MLEGEERSGSSDLVILWSSNLVAFILSLVITISKFEYPLMSAIASTGYVFVQALMFIWTDASVLTLQQQREPVIFVYLFLRISSAPARCASSPDRSSDPRLTTRSEGGFLDRIKTYTIEPCILDDFAVCE